MASVYWFEAESAKHPYGWPSERDFLTSQEALAFVDELKARDDVVHVQYEVPAADRPAMADGELIGQGWVRDGDTGAWRQQYRERLGMPYESGPEA